MTDVAPPPEGRWRVYWRRIKIAFWSLALLAAIAACAFAWIEMNASPVQAHYLTELAQEMHFELGTGISDSIRFPAHGPFDERYGYVALDSLQQRLAGRSFGVAAQARISPRMAEWMDHGLFPPYREKTQAGLAVLDCVGEERFRVRYPERIYSSFDRGPRLLVDSLLFI